MGEEFYNKGANVALGPGMNLARVPVNGRVFEYISGGDGYLGAKLVGPDAPCHRDTGALNVRLIDGHVPTALLTDGTTPALLTGLAALLTVFVFSPPY